MAAGDRTCPSAPCEPGNVLLGLVQGDGRVGYVTPALVIDQEFVDVARRGRSPGKRFRFAGPCVESGCTQWAGGRCGVIDTVLEERDDLLPDGAPAALPHCAIRTACRWFAQAGAEACHVCPLVITDP